MRKQRKLGLNSKEQLAVLDKIRVGEEMMRQKEQLEKKLKEGKAPKEQYETLTKKFKENGPEDTSVFDELRTKICKLEDEKQKAESQIEYWKMKAKNLIKRVSRLENETKLLMNGHCSNVGVNTVRDFRADTTTRVVKERKETFSSSHRNGSTHSSSGAPAWGTVIVVDSDEEECTIIQGKDANAQIATENGNGGASTGAALQDDGMGMLKRKLASTSPMVNSSSLDTDSSSSSSDSDFDIDQIPLKLR